MSEDKHIYVMVNDKMETIKEIVSSSNQAKDMIIKSLKKGDKSKKYTVDDVIEFLEGSHFRIETTDDKGEAIHNLVFKIPEKGEDKC